MLNEKFADHELRQLYDKAARALPKKSAGNPWAICFLDGRWKAARDVDLHVFV